MVNVLEVGLSLKGSRRSGACKLMPSDYWQGWTAGATAVGGVITRCPSKKKSHARPATEQGEFQTTSWSFKHLALSHGGLK